MSHDSSPPPHTHDAHRARARRDVASLTDAASLDAMSLARTTRASSALAGALVASALVAAARADVARAMRDDAAHASHTDHDARAVDARGVASARATALARWWNARVDDAFGAGVRACSDRGW